MAFIRVLKPKTENKNISIILFQQFRTLNHQIFSWKTM